MAKLDRQTDQAMSIAPITIVWRAFNHVDSDALLRQVKLAVDNAESRVPLDCRDVDGTPSELVDLLLEANEYALQSGKQLTIAFASDELRRALRPTVQRRPIATTRREAGKNDAATAALASLSKRINASPQIETPVISVPKTKAYSWPKTVKLLQRRGGLILAIILGTCSVIAIEFYLVFTDEDSINISKFVEEGIIPPVKTFEQ